MSGSNKTYSYDGKVAPGNQIGRTMGIPTINIPVNEVPNLPTYGVYAATVVMKDSGKVYEGVANLGVKPTIDNVKGTNPVGIEVNLFDFDGDLYDIDIRVDLHQFIREEMKFSNLEELKLQIERDIQTAKDYFTSHVSTL